VRLIGRLEIHELGMFARFTRKMHGNDSRLFPSVGAGSKYTSLAKCILAYRLKIHERLEIHELGRSGSKYTSLAKCMTMTLWFGCIRNVSLW